MQPLDLVGYTADLSNLVLVDPATGYRFTVAVTPDLVTALAEVVRGEDGSTLVGILSTALGTPAAVSVDLGAGSPAAALVSLGRAAPTNGSRGPMDGTASRLTPSEIQKLLRAGKPPEAVAEQAGISLDWVLRWFQPIAAEQGKVITSVLGSRQEREGFGLSDDLIGDSVRTNLLDRDVDPDWKEIQWTAARPEGRPYWTVTVRFTEGERTRRATWRYDIGTGRVSPRDDLALDLGWTAPIAHPSPGRMHDPAGEGGPTPPQAAPPPPPGPVPAQWAPPRPPPRRRPR